MPESRTGSFSDDLAGTNPDVAWRRFLDQYAGKIMGIVRQYERVPGTTHDCFLYVCEKLSEDGFRRLRQYDSSRGAGFGTWLTAVISRLCIDWGRMEYGRRRLPAAVLRLSSFDQELFRMRHLQHLDLSLCLQLARIGFPDTTRADLARSLERLHRALPPPKRWRVLQRSLRRSAPGVNAASAERGDDEPADNAPLPEDLIAMREERENVRVALARLTSEQQLLLRLRFQEELSFEDIARVTACGDLHRARRLIIDALEELAEWIQPR